MYLRFIGILKKNETKDPISQGKRRQNVEGLN